MGAGGADALETAALLEDELRRRDLDLWLASRLVRGPLERARLCALGLIQLELGQAGTAPATPLASEIRLAFWREALEGLLAGAPSAHPALRALAGAPARLIAPLVEAAQARHRELEPRPFASAGALFAHLEAADGPFVVAAAGVLGPGAPTRAPGAARALGLLRLLKARAAWAGRGRDFTPTEFDGAGDRVQRLRAAAAAARRDLLSELGAFSPTTFPALAHGVLLSAYAAGGTPSALGRRARIVLAAVRGRV